MPEVGVVAFAVADERIAGQLVARAVTLAVGLIDTVALAAEWHAANQPLVEHPQLVLLSPATSPGQLVQCPPSQQPTHRHPDQQAPIRLAPHARAHCGFVASAGPPTQQAGRGHRPRWSRAPSHALAQKVGQGCIHDPHGCRCHHGQNQKTLAGHRRQPPHPHPHVGARTCFLPPCQKRRWQTPGWRVPSELH